MNKMKKMQKEVKAEVPLSCRVEDQKVIKAKQ